MKNRFNEVCKVNISRENSIWINDWKGCKETSIVRKLLNIVTSTRDLILEWRVNTILHL
jgi:hypothetical protein